MPKPDKRMLVLLVAFCMPAGHAAEEEHVDVEQKVWVCSACHGENGASTVGQYPILAGQQEYYLYVQLKDFQSGLRKAIEMDPMVATLTKDEMKAIAKYFSEQQWPTLQIEVDTEKVKAGRTAAAAGQCPQCHLGGYNGYSRVPRLAGLHPEYLQKTMMDFKTKARNNSPAKSTLMKAFNEADIEAMAQYLGSLTVHQRSTASEVE